MEAGSVYAASPTSTTLLPEGHESDENRLVKCTGTSSLGWRDYVFGFGFLIVVCAVIGGALGYMLEAGVGDAIMVQASPRSSALRDYWMERLLHGSSEQEYERETRRGWWIGCAVGASVGTVFAGAVILLLKRREHGKDGSESARVSAWGRTTKRP